MSVFQIFDPSFPTVHRRVLEFKRGHTSVEHAAAKQVKSERSTEKVIVSISLNSKKILSIDYLEKNTPLNLNSLVIFWIN